MFQTERLIAKNTGITVRTLGHYFFEPLMFGFKIRFFMIVIEVFGFEFIRCPVHKNRVRSFVVIKVYICCDAFKKIFFRFETVQRRRTASKIIYGRIPV